MLQRIRLYGYTLILIPSARHVRVERTNVRDVRGESGGMVASRAPQAQRWSFMMRLMLIINRERTNGRTFRFYAVNRIYNGGSVDYITECLVICGHHH